MDEFVQHLLNENKIEFHLGNLSFYGMYCSVPTTTNVVKFFNLLHTKYGEKADEILRDVGEKQLRAWAQLIVPKAKIPLNYEQLDLVLKSLGVFGLGTLQIAQMASKENHHITFSLTRSSFHMLARRLYGHHVPNFYFLGICQGIAFLALGECMEASEIERPEVGALYIKAIPCPKRNASDIAYPEDLFLKLKKQDLPSGKPEFIHKVFGHNQLEWNGGLFSIWKIAGYIFPTATFVTIAKALEDGFGKEPLHILYHIGRTQARLAVEFQAKTFGFALDRKLMDSVLSHMDITGFGSSQITHFDGEKCVIEVESRYNPYPHTMKELFGKRDDVVDYYSMGLIAGTAEGIFQTKVFAQETRCAAKGDDFCTYRIEKAKEGSCPIDAQLLDIIEKNTSIKDFVP